MKEIVTFQVSVKVAGTWRVSPEYPTAEKAVSMIIPFVEKLQQKYTSCNIIRNVRYVSTETKTAQ